MREKILTLKIGNVLTRKKRYYQWYISFYFVSENEKEKENKSWLLKIKYKIFSSAFFS